MVSARSREVLAEYFAVNQTVAEQLPLRYNVAPTCEVYAVATTSAGRRLGVMGWGLVPSWANDVNQGPRPINARAETLLDKAHFASALEARRCIVPADGFYEWDANGRPHFVSTLDGTPLALAALWDRCTLASGDVLVSCAIVTTTANETLAPLHERMPVILDGSDWDTWLDTAAAGAATAAALLHPAPPDAVFARPVSRRVNSVANDDARLLEPADEELRLFDSL
jgi:putative SOS response-associated peptidase YedK